MKTKKHVVQCRNLSLNYDFVKSSEAVVSHGISPLSHLF